MISCYPECCMKEYEGNLLLHYILGLLIDDIAVLIYFTKDYVIEDDVIFSVIDMYPDAARMKNDHDKLPLLLECDIRCRNNVIMKLISIYPEAISIACNDYGVGYLPLHSVLFNFRSTSEVVLQLIEKYPDAVLAVYNGDLPIHMECSHQCRYDVVKKLLDIYPGAINIAASSGDYPLHLIGMLDYYETDTIIYLINLCQDVVRMKNSYDEYPLHAECRNQCRYDVIKKLLDIFPNSISIRNSESLYPLHLVLISVRIISDDYLNVIALLVTRYPAAVEAQPTFNPFIMMFNRLFDNYNVVYEDLGDYDIMFYHKYLRQTKAIAVDMFNLCPSALCNPDPAIQRNPVKYRLLLNLTSHHLSLPQHIQDYHDMNYKARSFFLQLIYKLSTSHIKHERMSDAINHRYHHADEMKHVWLRHVMVLARCKISEDKHAHVDDNMHVSYSWIKGDDLGQHLIRYVVGYL